MRHKHMYYRSREGTMSKAEHEQLDKDICKANRFITTEENKKEREFDRDLEQYQLGEFMTKTAFHLRLHLGRLRALLATELKSNNPSKLYIVDLQQSIADLEVSIDTLDIRGHCEMVS